MTRTQLGGGIIVAVLLGGLVYALGPILTPFLIAFLLAYITNPLALRLERWGLPRIWAVIIIFGALGLLTVILLLVLVPLLQQQISAFFAKIPDYLNRLQTFLLPWLRDYFQIGPEVLGLDALKQAFAEHWQKVGGVAQAVVGSVTNSGLALLGVLANLVLIPVVTFYLLRDWPLLCARLEAALPRLYRPVIMHLVGQCDSVLGAFLRGQALVMAALGVGYSLGLWLIGLDLALLIGLSAGLLSFVPYLGFAIGIGAALIAAWVQFQDLMHPLLVVGVFTLGQMAESMVLTPYLVGDRIGLHPVLVIFAVMAGGQLFGFTGILLALPAAAVIMVVVRYFYRQYHASMNGGNLPPECP